MRRNLEDRVQCLQQMCLLGGISTLREIDHREADWLQLSGIMANQKLAHLGVRPVASNDHISCLLGAIAKQNPNNIIIDDDIFQIFLKLDLFSYMVWCNEIGLTYLYVEILSLCQKTTEFHARHAIRAFEWKLGHQFTSQSVYKRNWWCRCRWVPMGIATDVVDACAEVGREYLVQVLGAPVKKHAYAIDQYISAHSSRGWRTPIARTVVKVIFTVSLENGIVDISLVNARVQNVSAVRSNIDKGGLTYQLQASSNGKAAVSCRFLLEICFKCWRIV